MKNLMWMILLIGGFCVSAHANGVGASMSQFHWEKRQLLVFASSKNDPQYRQFMREIQENRDEFEDRNLIVWRLIKGKQVRLDDQSSSELTVDTFQDRFNVVADNFEVILLGYDGEEKLRMREIDIETILVTIDGMPIRQMEMREAAEGSKREPPR